jgi:hypothetical protein
MQDDGSSTGLPVKASILLALAGLSMTVAQAAEPTGTLTLACQGERIARVLGSKIAPVQQQVSMGIIVNFTARTVKGFDSEWTDPIPIYDVTETAILFRGHRDQEEISGAIDRITGGGHGKLDSDPLVVTWTLQCKPTQRMF